MSQPSLRATLRHSTTDAHARVDALVGGGFVDETAYRRYLRGMHGLLGASGAVVDPLWSLAPLQALLKADMQALGVRPAPVVANDLAASVDEPSRLGVAYVVAGASVGARQLVRQAAALGYSPSRAGAFLHGFAQSTIWASVLAKLEAARLDGLETDRCRVAAVAAFATAEAAFQRAGEE